MPAIALQGTHYRGKNGRILNKLKPVLDNWIELVNQYSKTINEDSCYWYSERSNVGILAAAAWSSGKWIALEEFPTIKNQHDGPQKYGRCDLYLANIKKGHDLSFAIEAKHTWSASTANSSRLVMASNDAAALCKTEAAVRVATCFVVPSFATSKAGSSPDEFGGVISDWIKKIQDDVAYDGMAWVFPEKSRQLKNKHKKLSPGVCLLLNIRRRGYGKRQE